MNRAEPDKPGGIDLSPGGELYRRVHEVLRQHRLGSGWYQVHYIQRYLEMKQIDWALFEVFSGSILDVACHVPLDAVIYAAMPGVERIYMLDLRIPSPGSVPPNAQFVQCDATRIAFPDDAFDVVTSFSAVEHLPDRDLQRQWIHEMVRVTKPGGKLLITVDNAWSWFNRIWDRYRPPMYRISPPELREWVTEAGNIKIEATTGGGLYYWGFRPPIRGSAYVSYALDRLLAPLSPLLPSLGNRIGYRFVKG